MLEKYQGVKFESGWQKTEQFKRFAKSFRAAVVAQLKKADGAVKLKHFNVGHFYVSGFVYNADTEKYAYFSISDVRSFNDEWYHHVLYRTAETDRDYRGGNNNYSELNKLGENLVAITK